MRVAVTGAGGRLGRALIAALEEAPFTGPAGPIPWSRPDYDLDDPAAAGALVRRHGPEVVVHAAAWTDVDGCAREPGRAMRRNAIAVAELADACATAGVDLVLLSTNDVFDGRRTDGRGYAPPIAGPGNPYGASKLAGETSRRQASFLRRGGTVAAPREGTRAAGAGPQLAIVRTAWLFGPPGNDFPSKILAAAERARAAGEPLRVVGDEIGSPTYAPDLAEAIVELLAGGGWAGIHHVVNRDVASRAPGPGRPRRRGGRRAARRDPLASWTGPRRTCLGRPGPTPLPSARAPSVAGASPTTCRPPSPAGGGARR